MGFKAPYNPGADISDLSGKVILITGGTAGLGKETVTALVRHDPKQIVFTGRNAQVAERVIREAKAISPAVTVTFVECDQSSLASVQSAVKRFLELSDRLDIFIANAGIMGGDPGVSKDGCEIQFAINYLAHALFTKLLLPTMERTESMNSHLRIVLLSSVGFQFPPSGGIVFEILKSDQTDFPRSMLRAKWYRYGQSKLALVLLAQDLAQRHPLVTTVAVHPGVVNTGLIENKSLLDWIFLKLFTLGQEIPLNEGTWNTCWAATAEGEGQPNSGSMYEHADVPITGTRESKSVELRERLREWTEKELETFS